jgi:hypothetical protein
MQKKLKSLEAKLKADEERSTAVDHIFGNQMKVQSRLDARNAVEAFYTGNTPFYQEMSRQIGLLTAEVLLLKENNAGQELYEASATMASTIPKKGKLTLLQLADIIKEKLGFDQSLPVNKLADAVSQAYLNQSQIDELIRIDKIPDKLQYIAITLGIETSAK